MIQEGEEDTEISFYDQAAISIFFQIDSGTIKKIKLDYDFFSKKILI